MALIVAALAVLLASAASRVDAGSPVTPAGPSVSLGAVTASAAGQAAQLQQFYAAAQWADIAKWVDALEARNAAAAAHKVGSSHAHGHATGGGSKACVANTENNGSYDRSSNPGHFGRYQFSRSTWIAYGGDPATWGTASPSEQDRVFETAWNSPGGPSNWLPYDGC